MKPARPSLSLAGRLTAIFLVALVAAAAVAAWASQQELSPATTFLLCLLTALPLGAWLLNRLLRPLSELVQALHDAIDSLRDGDFSIRLVGDRRDELGQVVRAYNRAVDMLRDERTALRQRELLLETALERSPLAIVLSNARDRVVFANAEARRLLLGGAKLEGHRLREIAEGCPPSMREVLEGGSDGLFTVDDTGAAESAESEPETYHLSQRTFQLNQQRHSLLLLRRLTLELSREEVRIWKKVIRIISHELNNSLAPISSLVHSAGLVIEHKPGETHRLPPILGSIEERLAHLREFLEGYARFARLPRPRPEPVAWRPFLDGLAELYPFRLEGEPPSWGSFDPAQLQQVLINLLKNAQEASPEANAEVTVRVVGEIRGGTLIQVLDRGTGMGEEAMRQALLPFYSTKTEGSGIGLPLCREILAEHGGTLRLESRPGGGTAVSCWLPPV